MSIKNKKTLEKILFSDVNTRIGIFQRQCSEITYNKKDPDEVEFIENIKRVLMECLRSGDKDYISWTCSFIINSKITSDEIWNWAKSIIYDESNGSTEVTSIERSAAKLSVYLADRYQDGLEVFCKNLNNKNEWIRYDQYNGAINLGLRIPFVKICRYGPLESNEDSLCNFISCVGQSTDVIQDKIAIFEKFAVYEKEKIRKKALMGLRGLGIREEIIGYIPKCDLSWLLELGDEKTMRWLNEIYRLKGEGCNAEQRLLEYEKNRKELYRAQAAEDIDRRLVEKMFSTDSISGMIKIIPGKNASVYPIPYPVVGNNLLRYKIWNYQFCDLLDEICKINSCDVIEGIDSVSEVFYRAYPDKFLCSNIVEWDLYMGAFIGETLIKEKKARWNNDYGVTRSGMNSLVGHGGQSLDIFLSMLYWRKSKYEIDFLSKSISGMHKYFWL